MPTRETDTTYFYEYNSLFTSLSRLPMADLPKGILLMKRSLAYALSYGLQRQRDDEMRFSMVLSLPPTYSTCTPPPPGGGRDTLRLILILHAGTASSITV